MHTIPFIDNDPRFFEALARVEILYTDLDGTLLAPGGSVLADGLGAPSVSTAETITSLARTGLKAVPVSGRSRIQLAELTRLLGWSDFIAEAGAVIVRRPRPGAPAEVAYNNGEWPTTMPAATGNPTAATPENAHRQSPASEAPYQAIARAGIADALMEAFPGRIEYHTPWDTGNGSSRESTHLLRGFLDLEAARTVLDAFDPPTALLDNGPVRNAGTLACAEESVPTAYHLVPRGVSKAQAIALDLKARGLDRSQAAAIGDSATDLEMADATGVMVLVANAFADPGVCAALSRPTGGLDTPSVSCNNIWRTHGLRGDGWSEFVRAWLAIAEQGKPPGHRSGREP
ncbi:MAG: HAD hydrolase family protein [Coriobacteriia bacterium]|nr:HAD hydrolase family protein [Coriobacteriia bacterium]